MRMYKKGDSKMASIGRLLAVAALIGALGAFPGIAAETVRAFGFGGGMATAFFPDLSEVNAFLSENGLDPFGDSLIGAGGNGRGGTIGGTVAGGIGWGVVAASEMGDRHAELVFGGGGVDVGWAIGGDDRSVLTVGCVLGGGATVLTFGVEEAEPQRVESSGIVIGPAERTIGTAIGLACPYVSLEAQLLSWVGLELRIGYLLPLFGIPFGDLLGVPAPSLHLSGPLVSLGLVFGGIGAVPEGGEVGVERPVETGGSFVLAEGAELCVENGRGNVVVLSYPAGAAQTGSGRVEWTASVDSKPRKRPGPSVAVEGTSTGVVLRTAGCGRVDYEVRIPAGTSLAVRNGVGGVEVSSHEAESIVIENGVGDIRLSGLQASALVVAAGIGDVELIDVEAVALTAHVGIGKLALGLRADAPATIVARVGLGDAFCDPFPGTAGGISGRFGRGGKLVLAGGGPLFDLSIGIGRLEVRALQP